MPLINILALLGLMIGLGMGHTGRLHPRLNRVISRALVQFVYPCLIFASLLLRFTWAEVEAIAAVPLLVFVMCGLGLIYGRLSLPHAGLRQNPSQRSYVFLALLPNYSYVPLVVSQALWGDKGIAMVAIAAVGADLFLWTLGFPVIAGKLEWRKIFSPALVTLVLALVLLSGGGNFHAEPWLTALTIMSWIGKATLPLSMYILGLYLMKAGRRIDHKKAQGLLLAWRLCLCPLMMFALILICGASLPYLAKAVLLLIASMPSAIVSVVLADLHGADGTFAAKQILLGHSLGIITVAFWQVLLFYGLR